MGLDKAVLQGVENKGEDILTSAETERLLRYGAYEVLAEHGNDGKTNSFMEEDIDTILLSRTKTRVHESNLFNDFTFKKASFKASEGDLLEGYKECNVDIDDPDFWTKIFITSSDVKDDEAISPIHAPDKEPKTLDKIIITSESTPDDNNCSDYKGGIAAQIVPKRSSDSLTLQATMELDSQAAKVTQKTTSNKLSETKDEDSEITKVPEDKVRKLYKEITVKKRKRKTDNFSTGRDSSTKVNRRISSATSALQALKKNQKTTPNPDVASSVSRRSPRIKEQETKDQCSIASTLELHSRWRIELQEAITTGVSTNNEKEKGVAKATLNDTCPVNKIHEKTNSLKSKAMGGVMSSSKSPLGKDLESKASVPHRKPRPRKVLKENTVSIVESDQRLHFENNDEHDKSSTNKKTQRKTKKPQYYEPLEIQRSSSKRKHIQSKRKSAAKSGVDTEIALEDKNGNSKKQQIPLLRENAPKTNNVSEDRATKSQFIPKQNRSSRCRSVGDQNPCSWAVMGSSTSFEQSIEIAPTNRKVHGEKRTKRLSHGSVLENMFSSLT